MFYGKSDNPSDFFKIKQHRVENDKQLTYLGSEIEYQNEINLRSEREFLSPITIYLILENNENPTWLKLGLKCCCKKQEHKSRINICLRTWSLTATEEKILVTFDLKVQRIIFRGINDSEN